MYVVGDTHGQVHDVLKMLTLIDAYQSDCYIIFNGVTPLFLLQVLRLSQCHLRTRLISLLPALTWREDKWL